MKERGIKIGRRDGMRIKTDRAWGIEMGERGVESQNEKQ